jgi:organic anion transporter 3A
MWDTLLSYDDFRYVGLCAGIKILALALFLIDWWLVRRRRQMEDQPPSFTVNEFVGSIISLDKRKWFIISII